MTSPTFKSAIQQLKEYFQWRWREFHDRSMIGNAWIELAERLEALDLQLNHYPNGNINHIMQRLNKLEADNQMAAILQRPGVCPVCEKYPRPNEETIQAMNEDISTKKRFKNVKDLMTDLNDEPLPVWGYQSFHSTSTPADMPWPDGINVTIDWNKSFEPETKYNDPSITEKHFYTTPSWIPGWLRKCVCGKTNCTLIAEPPAKSKNAIDKAIDEAIDFLNNHQEKTK